METIPTQIPPPLPTLAGDDKVLIILSHLSLLLGVGFLLPLIVWLVKKNESPVVVQHARETLNFHLCVYIYGLIAFALCFAIIGFVLLPIIGVGALVLSVVGAMKASDGVLYRYPLTIRFF